VYRPYRVADSWKKLPNDELCVRKAAEAAEEQTIRMQLYGMIAVPELES
jgi:hypothetical protein